MARGGLFEVDVLEALEEGKISGPTIRSWNVVLNRRGRGALESAGVDLQEEVGVALISVWSARTERASRWRVLALICRRR